MSRILPTLCVIAGPNGSVFSSEEYYVKTMTYITYIWRFSIVLLAFPPKITKMSPKIHTA